MPRIRSDKHGGVVDQGFKKAHRIFTIEDLEKKIRSGEIQEHPGWEDLIELRNIESEILEIDSDIRSLQTT